MVSFCWERFLFCFATAVLIFFIVGLLFICASSTSITWEHTLHPVRRPSFSSHLFATANICPRETQLEIAMNNFDRGHITLLEELRTLETELHSDKTRHDRRCLETLLHADFIEFGRSGRRYTRADMLKEFGLGNVLPPIRSSNFELVVLCEGAALLTYVSAQVDAGGNSYRQSLRSSIWVRTKVGWQMRFHQGTPVHQPEF
jgi:hypothetical protein